MLKSLEMLLAILSAIQPPCSKISDCDQQIQECYLGYCRCLRPFVFGDECTLLIDDCNQEICSGNGNCDYRTSQCVCSDNFDPTVSCAACNLGFVFVNGYCYAELCLDPDNKVFECSEHGTCIDAKECECTEEYIGQYCQFVKDDCDSNCNANQHCNNLGECQCNEHFSEPDCQACENGFVLFVDRCVTNGTVAENSTLCSDRGNYLDEACDCQSGFYGNACQLNESECDAQHCAGLGACQMAANKLSCECRENRIGLMCAECAIGYEMTDIGHCIADNCWIESTECALSGKCENGICVCDTNRVGSKCELDLSECSKTFCSAQGQCDVDAENEFKQCKCNISRQGAACEKCAPKHIFSGVCWPTTTVGVVGGVVGGIILIILIAGIIGCCCRRKLVVKTALRRSVGVGSAAATTGSRSGMEAAMW